jgi:hypothetical protein
MGIVATDNLIVEINEDGRRARVHQPLRMFDAGGVEYVVPAGFETDFASVPRFLWRIIPPWGEYSRAAVVHDYLYRNGIGTRAKADEAFRSLMQHLRVSWWKRNAMYAAVRLFGRPAWKGRKANPRKGLP